MVASPHHDRSSSANIQKKSKRWSSTMFSMLFVPEDLFLRSKQALVTFPQIPSWNFFGKIIFSKDGWGANWRSSSFDISLDIRTILNFSQCDKSWLMSSILFCLLLKAIWLDRLVLPLIPPNQSLHTKVHDFCNVPNSTWLQISTQISFGVTEAILFFQGLYKSHVLLTIQSMRKSAAVAPEKKHEIHGTVGIWRLWNEQVN